MDLHVTDGHLHRMERLQKLIRAATTMCGLSESQADELIYSITDDRGYLRILWKHDPTELQRKAFESAWLLCREKADKVEHSVA